MKYHNCIHHVIEKNENTKQRQNSTADILTSKLHTHKRDGRWTQHLHDTSSEQTKLRVSNYIKYANDLNDSAKLLHF